MEETAPEGDVQTDHQGGTLGVLLPPWSHPPLYKFSIKGCVCVSAYARTQSCVTLCNPVDCNPPGSSVHRVSQSRILEWVAIAFSREIFLTQESNLHLVRLLHWQGLLGH